MNKKYLLYIFPFLLFIAFILHLNSDSKKNKEYSVEMADYMWEYIDTKYCRFQTKEECVKEAKYYIETISDFVSKPEWYKEYKDKHGEENELIISYIFTSEISHVEDGYHQYLNLMPNIYLNKLLFEYDLAPIAHETTHIILPYYSSLTLREGLASYCQDAFGKNLFIFSYGIDIHIYANCYFTYNFENYNKIFDVIGTDDIYQEIYTQGNLRIMFYNMSHSFSKYLIETYGIEKFMAIYESENLQNDYKAIYDKSLDELKVEWQEMLETLPEPMNPKEIKEYIQQFYEKNNYPYEMWDLSN